MSCPIRPMPAAPTNDARCDTCRGLFNINEFEMARTDKGLLCVICFEDYLADKHWVDDLEDNE